MWTRLYQIQNSQIGQLIEALLANLISNLNKNFAQNWLSYGFYQNENNILGMEYFFDPVYIWFIITEMSFSVKDWLTEFDKTSCKVSKLTLLFPKKIWSTLT